MTRDPDPSTGSPDPSVLVTARDLMADVAQLPVPVIFDVRWQLGDQGTGSAPATDTVKDFVASQGDALDLRDLLPDGLVAAGSLGDYLSFSYDAAASTTVLSIRTQGTTMSAPDQIIRLEGVDLLGGLSDNDQIIQNLIHNGRLIAD